MTINELREEMESELTWRTDELRMLKNNLEYISKIIDKEKYRKSLLVMLYSHFEGFSKICFLIYIKFINSKNLKRINLKDKPELIASCMNDIFKYYDDKDRKNKFFNRTLPDDKAVHSVYRRVDLINGFKTYLDDIVIIDDNVINTESNLKSFVLSKNFYMVGIDYAIFKEYNVDIDKLVNLRNSIAHGSEKTGIKEEVYNKLEKVILNKVMNKLIIIFEKQAKDIENLI